MKISLTEQKACWIVEIYNHFELEKLRTIANSIFIYSH